MTEEERTNLPALLFVILCWFLITQYAGLLDRLFAFGQIHTYLLPAIRMTLLCLVTYAYVRIYEKRGFRKGFNFSFRKVGRNLIWALVIFALSFLAERLYQLLIVTPLTKRAVEASSGASRESIGPLFDRLVAFGYVVYEGIVEVLIFIGFLLDRLMKKWGVVRALLATNVVFALWHYGYLKNGWLEGSLMIVLTFVIGIIVSLGYVQTRNSLSPIIAHFLVDLPSNVRELLGIL
jgi:membrane protease YdiL (CAAX protease family)